MAGQRRRRLPRPDLRAAADRGHRPGDRPRRPRPHGAVLLAGLRRHLAPAPGALALPLSGRTVACAGGQAQPELPSSFSTSVVHRPIPTGRTRGTEEPGMRQLPALDMSSNVTKFWRSYVYIGVLTYSLGAFAVLAYSMTTPGPHRQAMVILSGLSLIASIAGVPAPRPAPGRDAVVQVVLHLVGRLHLRLHRRRSRPRRRRAQSHLVLPDSADALRRPGVLGGHGLVPGRLRCRHDAGGRFPDSGSQLVHDRVPGGRDRHRRRASRRRRRPSGTV